MLVLQTQDFDRLIGEDASAGIRPSKEGHFSENTTEAKTGNHHRDLVARLSFDGTLYSDLSFDDDEDRLVFVVLP